MNILAFDSSMQSCSVAILRDGELFGQIMPLERGHAERLMPMMQEVLASARINIGQIDRFAVCRGPGTFTGVRIGIATARGLALATGKPLVGIGSLQVMAAQIIRRQTDLPGSIGIAADARRGEIYWQLFNNKGVSVRKPLALSPESVATSLKNHKSPLILAGTGANMLASLIDGDGTDRVITVFDQLQPDAADLAKLACTLPVEQQPVGPLYLRAPDAKVQTGFAVARQ